MGGRPYPQQRLNDAWTLVMGGQFHDTGAGTATPRSYEFAQNDDVIAMNQFAEVLTSATQAVASGLDTQGAGNADRRLQPAEHCARRCGGGAVDFPGAAPKAVEVTGPDGQPVPSQVDGGKVLFLAKTPSVGYAVFTTCGRGKAASGAH